MKYTDEELGEVVFHYLNNRIKTITNYSYDLAKKT